MAFRFLRLRDVFSFFAQGTLPTGNAYGELASPGGFGVGTFTLTAVPEPATCALLLLGFSGIGFAVRRARRNAVEVAAGSKFFFEQNGSFPGRRFCLFASVPAQLRDNIR